MPKENYLIDKKTVPLKLHCNMGTAGCAKVTLADTVTVPAGSEMEITGHVHSAVRGTWLVENDDATTLSVCVARTHATNQGENVLLRAVNTGLTPATLHRNSKIAIAELTNDAEICTIGREGCTL